MRRVLEKEDEFSYNPSINKKVDERSVTRYVMLVQKDENDDGSGFVYDIYRRYGYGLCRSAAAE